MQRSTVICVLGPPGSGKSTQVALLQRHFTQAVVGSVPLLRRRQGALADTLTAHQAMLLDGSRDAAETARLQGALAPLPFDRVLFELAAACRATQVILDGAPRGPRQARMFLNILVERAVFVVLGFRGAERSRSLQRQQSRAEQRGMPIDDQLLRRFQGKALTFENETAKGIEIVAAAGRPVLRVDASMAADAAHRQIVDFLDSVSPT